MLNRPWSSVTTVRTFSMSAGLTSSTVTPGSTPPDMSRAAPAMPAGDNCAAALRDRTRKQKAVTKTCPAKDHRCMAPPDVADLCSVACRQQRLLPGRQLLIEHRKEDVFSSVRRDDVDEEIGEILLTERCLGASVGLGG